MDRERRSFDFYYGDYEDEQEQCGDQDSGIIDESCLKEEDADVSTRIINGWANFRDQVQIWLRAHYVAGMTPWLVALADARKRDGCNWSHFCGGTLIHSQE